jgi:hypothetical protein
MTAGNDGASTPADDDPFGYLYADGQASGATPPSGGGGYGYPGARTSYHQVRPVGERQYGQQQGGARGGQGHPAAQGRPATPGQPGGNGQPDDQGRTAVFQNVPGQGGQGYGAPNAHYQAPETLPGRHGRQGPPRGYDGGGRGRGPNTRGLLIGAIAVVAAVAIGIGVAVFSGDEGAGGAQPGDTPAPTGSAQSSQSADQPVEEPADLPKIDAKSLRLDGGTVLASDIKGARADGGVYVTGLNQVGATVTWTFSVEKAGPYRLDVRYGIPGEDANATLLVNGKSNTEPLGLKNFINSAKGDWEKGWQTTWAPITLNKGTNVIAISCSAGNQCNANIDQVAIEPPKE